MSAQRATFIELRCAHVPNGGASEEECRRAAPADRGVAGSRGEDLLALLAQLALRPDVPVERHGFDPEFNAECGHGRVTVGHRGLGQPHLGFRQRELPAAVVAARRASRYRSSDWELAVFDTRA